MEHRLKHLLIVGFLGVGASAGLFVFIPHLKVLSGIAFLIGAFHFVFVLILITSVLLFLFREKIKKIHGGR